MKRYVRSQRVPRVRLQRGVGLLEVLIAVLVLGVGLLGIAALQATALRNSQSSLERSQAVIHSYAILEAMRANVEQARIGKYDLTTMTCSPPDTGDVVANDLNAWITNMQASLGSTACGQISCTAQECVVTIRWNDDRGVGGEKEQTHVTRTRL